MTLTRLKIRASLIEVVMVLHKQNYSEKKEKDWFMFAMSLRNCLFSDYALLKLTFYMETLTFSHSHLVGMAEVVEKAFKIYLAKQEKVDKSLEYFSTSYGHNLEKLRAKAEMFNPIFGSDDIKAFTKPFGDKRGALYQKFRYGSEKTIKGFSTDLAQLMPIVDKIFYSCVLQLNDIDKRMLNHGSLLACLIEDSPFHQANNRDLLLQAIQANNPYFKEYEDYTKQLAQEDKKLMESIQVK